MKAPPGYRFDPFADVRMGRSLFQMEPEDWLVRDSDQSPEGRDATRLDGEATRARADRHRKTSPSDLNREHRS
jgi:hypothetical protein